MRGSSQPRSLQDRQGGKIELNWTGAAVRSPDRTLSRLRLSAAHERAPFPASQYASALRISPMLIVFSAFQFAAVMLLLTNRTEPSPNRVLIPPEWRLFDPT